jgi:hypothetical protein
MSRPLIVAILPYYDEPHRDLYHQAYGLEMQIDNEWELDLVLLVPPEYLNVLINETDVTGEDAAIVSAGVTTPQPAYEAPCNWVLLEKAADVSAALRAGARPILRVASADQVSGLELDRVVLAVPDVFALRSVRERAPGARIIVSGARELGDADGLLLDGADFEELLELMTGL